MAKQNSLIQLYHLPEIQDDCSLVVAEKSNIPFPIRRLYYIYNPAPRLARGFHAHYKTSQLLFCIKGSVRMVLDDGENKEEATLNKPSDGILLKPLIWHEMHDMTEETILLVLASHTYSERDYIRDYKTFLKISKP